MKRRSFIGLSSSIGLLASVLPASSLTASVKAENEKRYQNGASPWPICLDTATIRPASLLEKINIAAKAGYDGIEPWDGELEEYEKNGGNLKVNSGVGFTVY